MPISRLNTEALDQIAEVGYALVPSCPDCSTESADDNAIHFSQQSAGQDHEVGGGDARVQIQLSADEGRSLVCQDPESCGGYLLNIVFKTSKVKRTLPRGFEDRDNRLP
jgi:hypothetical protein